MALSLPLTNSAAGRTERLVLPEQLDALAADDPRARRSRRDLMRVHRAMRSVMILRRAITRMRIAAPRRVLELGAGDGSLLLRLAQRLRPPWRDVRVTLIDRQQLIDADTKAGFAALGWSVEARCVDVIEWAETPGCEHFDVCLTTLFLHHFEARQLTTLLAAVAARADAFIALEPRRSVAAHLGSRSIGLLGANAVTRADAVTSVAAGFAGQELTSLWSRALAPHAFVPHPFAPHELAPYELAPHASAWRLSEFAAFPFAHCFAARRSKEAPHLGR